MTQNVEGLAARQASGGGVQSVQRALDIFQVVANGGGQMAIGEIAEATSIPLPTIHRLLKTLVERGYMRQLRNRRYALGFRLVPLGIAANATISSSVRAALGVLVDELGETANLAILSGDYAEYVAQAPSYHAMRMFTEVGRRVEMHCTGVGKALLAQLSDEQVLAIVRRVGMPSYTEYTVVTEGELLLKLMAVRELGYALDEQEQEAGVRCVAVPVPAGVDSWMAVSISGPLTRMTDEVIGRAVPALQAAAARIGNEIVNAAR